MTAKATWKEKEKGLTISLPEREDTEEADEPDDRCCVPVSDKVKGWLYNGSASLSFI